MPAAGCRRRECSRHRRASTRERMKRRQQQEPRESSSRGASTGCGQATQQLKQASTKTTKTIREKVKVCAQTRTFTRATIPLDGWTRSLLLLLQPSPCGITQDCSKNTDRMLACRVRWLAVSKPISFLGPLVHQMNPMRRALAKVLQSLRSFQGPGGEVDTHTVASPKETEKNQPRLSLPSVVWERYCLRSGR